MGFSYTTSPAGAKDKVRLLIADTSAASYTFEDDEITIALDLWSQDVQLAAVQLLRSRAAALAANAISYSVGGFSMNRTALADKFLALADAIERGGVKYHCPTDGFSRLPIQTFTDAWKDSTRSGHAFDHWGIVVL